MIMDVSALVIPEFRFINKNVVDFVKLSQEKNFPVFFINSLPKYISEYNVECDIEVSPGSIVLLDRKMRAAYSGDACNSCHIRSLRTVV